MVMVAMLHIIVTRCVELFFKALQHKKCIAFPVAISVCVFVAVGLVYCLGIQCVFFPFCSDQRIDLIYESLFPLIFGTN